MAYKTLLTVLTDAEHSDHILKQVSGLAQAFDAHVEALCIGVNRTPHGYYQAGGDTMILQMALEQARSESQVIGASAEKILEAAGVRFDAETTVAALPAIGDTVANRAHFADLVVLPLPYGDGKGEEMQTTVEAALFGGRAPVLVMPDEAPDAPNYRTILVAWDQSIEAMVAVRKALPLLKKAENVRIVMIDPPKHGAEQADPGGQLSRMLDRHGVECEVDLLTRSMPRTSDVIRRHITDTGADLLVMGAYGHSRFREAILGGATRNMLESTPIPVFMAH